jgi:VIT1/CCC1 family predicted Fe2+/Mn2+ transporter
MVDMPEYTHSHASEKKLVDMVRQLFFGLGHGLISILGLSIGVTYATGNTRTIAIAGVVGTLTGLATLIALQYLSAKTQKEVFQHMIEEERKEFQDEPEVEKLEMRKYYIEEGFTAEEADAFVNRLSLDKDRWLKAHITHVLEFIPSKTVNPLKESITLGLSHLLGATIALFPYLLINNLNSAAYVSILLASITLIMAGGLKTRVTGGKWYVSAVEFFVLGMVAVIAGYLVGVAIKGFA